MTSKIDQPTPEITSGEVVDPNKRFDEALAGKKLTTIREIIPHQDEMQALIRKKLTEIFKDSNQDEISVVEIGTGTGYTAKEILAADERIKITSFDNEPKMVLEAEENLKSDVEAGRVELRQADALDFLKNVSDNSLDSIASAFVIHNFEKSYREQVIREIYRALKPGGVFINSDKVYPDDESECQKEHQWCIDAFKNSNVDEDVRKGWIDHYEFDSRPEIIIHESEMRTMLEEFGFKDIDISNRNHLEVFLSAKK